MKKAPLYSRSQSAARPKEAAPGDAPPAPSAAGQVVPQRPSAWRLWAGRYERRLWGALVLLVVAAGAAVNVLHKPPPAPLSLDQIDRAMRKSIAQKPLASPAAAAYEAILPSVVRVVGLLDDKDDGSDTPVNGKMERGVGTGVVIMENGTILTNLHVVFFDGLDSDADLINAQPENDLAVLKAKRLPDDLQPATMRSTGDLRPGDEVVAVGFPFGIGPSASSGIVSGLKREFRSPEGEHTLTNLIQFDAAANPGNSGGPLVTMGRRGRRHRDGDPETRRTSACSSASALRCRSRTRPLRPACRRSDPSPRRSLPNFTRALHRDCPCRLPPPTSAQASTLMEEILYEVKRVVVGQGSLPRTRDGRGAGARASARRRRAGAGQDAHRQDARVGPARQLQAHPVHARSGAGRSGRHAHLQPAQRRVLDPRSARSSRTCCSPTKSTARRPRCRAPSSK